MRQIPILGLGFQSGFPAVTAQERVNCYLEEVKDGDKYRIAAFGTPGKEQFFDLGASPIRGVFSYGDYGYVIQDNELFQVNNGGTCTSKGTIGTSSGFVSMACNGTQIFIADGTANAYYYTIATGVLAQSDSPAIETCCFMDGYIVGNEIDTGKYYISNLYNAAVWDPLDFASAESNPDNLVRVFADHGGVLLFGDFTTEIVGNNGAEDFPFSRIGYPIEWGLIAKQSVAKLGDQVAFLARNRMGEAQVVLMSGYNPREISTHDIDRILNNSTTLESATAFSYMLNGHQFYQLNAAGYSFLYDISTGAWSQVKGYLLDRDRGEMAFNLINRIIVTDYDNGKAYTVSDDVYDDNGDPLIMSITGKHLFNSADRVTVSELFVDLVNGVGATTGQGSDPQIMLKVSKDGGNTWGNEQWKSFGAIGRFLTRVSWWRLGRAYEFTFRISISDPVKRCIMGAWITAQ